MPRTRGATASIPRTLGPVPEATDPPKAPTALRSSYAGLRIIAEAGAAVLGDFGLAACLTWLGRLELAIAVWVPTLVVPAPAIFWWATTETRGMLLDEAALEDPLNLPERRP